MTTQPPARSDRSPTLADFITDGALAAFCDHMSALAGVRITLRDADGRTINGAGPPDLRLGSRIPLIVAGRTVGTVEFDRESAHAPASDPRAVHLAVALVVHMAEEFCQASLDLRTRVHELEALHGLAALLARASRLDDVLRIALDTALEVLRLDAGSIVLFDDERGVHSDIEEDVLLIASKGLSKQWLDSPLPLSRDREFDRRALRGELVESTDLQADPRVLILAEVQEQGLHSFFGAGLLFDGRPIGVLRLYARTRRTLTDSDRRLIRSIAEHAAIAVEQARLLKLQERDAATQRQLQLAGDVQRRMLPRNLPRFDRFDVATRYIPHFRIGGDFYDLVDVPAGLGIAVGDVVGNGLAAALLMASLRATIRAHLLDGHAISEVLTLVNAALCRDTLMHEFATVWYGELSPHTLKLAYASGGHDPPFVVRPTSARPTIIDLHTEGMAVGIDPDQTYDTTTVQLEPGDVLVVHTDGLTDALSFDRERFGRNRLRATVADAVATGITDANQLLEHVFWTLRQHTGLTEKSDDQTLVIVRVGEPGSPAAR